MANVIDFINFIAAGVKYSLALNVIGFPYFIIVMFFFHFSSGP